MGACCRRGGHPEKDQMQGEGGRAQMQAGQGQISWDPEQEMQLRALVKGGQGRIQTRGRAFLILDS